MDEAHAVTNEEIEARLTALLADDPENLEEIDSYIEEVGDDYAGDIVEVAFRIAVRTGAANYVTENVDTVELNDDDGFSSYLFAAANSEIEEILMDNGALRPMDWYDDYRFSVESVNWEILAFDEDFQQEVFDKLLEVTGLTEEDVAELLSGNEPEELDLPDDFSDYEDVFESLGISLNSDGEVELTDMVGSDGSATMSYLEALGWSCEFEGDSWKLQTTGVYFIE